MPNRAKVKSRSSIPIERLPFERLVRKSFETIRMIPGVKSRPTILMMICSRRVLSEKSKNDSQSRNKTREVKRNAGIDDVLVSL